MATSTSLLGSASNSHTYGTSLKSSMSSLQRLDDKVATGLTVTDMAKARWLTPVEVLDTLDRAEAAMEEGAGGNEFGIQIVTSPPDQPPRSGTLLIFNPAATPNYDDDGITWKNDKGQYRFVNVEAVVEGGAEGECGVSKSSSSSLSTTTSAKKVGARARLLTCTTRPTFHRREYHGPGKNKLILFHYLDSIRALRTSSMIVDQIISLSYPKMGPAPPPASMLEELPIQGQGGMDYDHDHHHRSKSGHKLDETMSILMGMIDEDDDPSKDNIGPTTIGLVAEAATSALMKHISPDEEKRIIDAMEDVLEEKSLASAMSKADSDDDGIGFPNELTEFDIDEAIDQVLTGTGDAIEGDVGMVLEGMAEVETGSCGSVASKSCSVRNGNTAKVVENIIIDALEGALSDDLRIKLLRTTEALLDVDHSATLKQKNEEEEITLASSASSSVGHGFPLPDIVDFTPGQHVIGTEMLLPEHGSDGTSLVGGCPVAGRKSVSKDRAPQMVISTKTPLPELPLYVDNFSKWVYFAAFVDYLQIHEGEQGCGDDVAAAAAAALNTDSLVKQMSFQRIKIITPYSYKCKIPSDISISSCRHVILVGVLLPKDDDVFMNYLGIELALKLCIQSECAAAADLVTAVQQSSKKKVNDNKLVAGGIRRPVLIAPCGGNYVQLLSQISPDNFTFFSAEQQVSQLGKILDPCDKVSSEESDGRAAIPAPGAIIAAAGALLNYPDRPDNKALGADIKMDLQKSLAETRKRGRDDIDQIAVSSDVVDANERAEDWARSQFSSDGRTNAERTDRHLKIRFVERIANAISGTSDEATSSANSNEGMKNEFMFDSTQVDNMKDEEIDSLLDSVLIRFVEVAIEGSTSEAELRKEINFRGYSGLTLLHYGALYNFVTLITFLLSRGADPNMTSMEGDLTPLHFAAAAGHDQVVDLLLKQKGEQTCNPCPCDSYGLTPAEHALRAGHVQIAKYLDARSFGQVRVSSPAPPNLEPSANVPVNAMDVVLQSAFKELSLKDKLGLNLFVDRNKKYSLEDEMGQGITIDLDNKMNIDANSNNEAGWDQQESFSFISEEDRGKLKVAMSLASGMDLEEMNRRAGHQDVRRYLKQSNLEAIQAASFELNKSKKRESNALANAKTKGKEDENASKTKLGQALAMLVLRKNLPKGP